jgi:hypothetical protein
MQKWCVHITLEEISIDEPMKDIRSRKIVYRRFFLDYEIPIFRLNQKGISA